MPAISFVSVDMPASSAPGGAPSAPTGQEGIFASHLASAAAKQGSAAQQPAAVNKNNGSAQVSDADEPKEAAQQTSAAVDSISATQPTEDTSVAGATEETPANTTEKAAIDQALLYFTWAAATDLNAAATVIQTLDNQTTIDRMLGAISTGSTGNATLQATVTTTAQQSPATIAATNQTATTQMLVITTEDQTDQTASAAMDTAGQFSSVETLGVTSTASATFAAPASQTAETAPANTTADAASTAAQATTDPTGQSTAKTVTEAITAGASAQSVSLQQNATRQGFNQIGQGEYNQIITLHQTGQSEETASANLSENTSSATVATNDTVGSTRQDASQNYIESKMAKATDTTGQNQANNEQQSDLNGEQQKGGTPEAALAQAQAESSPQAQKPQFILNQDGQPLIFAQTREAAAPLVSSTATPTTATAESAMLRLPSGMMVPEGTVIDQMITRLSLNQRLETSTVNLKLYPQELGELRMEIKVEQDNIKAHIITQNPQAQEMIDRHIPRLREALEQQGLHLQQVEVTIAANDNGNDHRYQDNSRQQQLNRSMQSTITQPTIRIETAELDNTPAYNSSSNLSILA